MEPENISGEPKTWRVVCVKLKQIARPQAHVHVIGLGTGDSPTWADLRWTLAQALKALADGEQFFTLDESTGEQNRLEKTACPICHQTILARTGPAKLEDLRECVYQADPEFSFSDS